MMSLVFKTAHTSIIDKKSRLHPLPPDTERVWVIQSYIGQYLAKEYVLWFTLMGVLNPQATSLP